MCANENGPWAGTELRSPRILSPWWERPSLLQTQCVLLCSVEAHASMALRHTLSFQYFRSRKRDTCQLRLTHTFEAALDWSLLFLCEYCHHPGTFAITSAYKVMKLPEGVPPDPASVGRRKSTERESVTPGCD